jgi:trk system potassium uptake protein TrkH
MPDPDQPSATPRRCNIASVLPLVLLTLIVVATLLLKLPASAPEGGSISWLEAAFTATSAVTLTGLTAVDTATRFSPIGKSILCVFIQLGGLAVLSGGACLTSRFFSAQTVKPATLIRNVVLATLAIEAVGGLCMFPLWGGDLTLADRAALSAFHAVSAFCNAGFSLQSDSLVNYRFSLLSHAVIAPLIVIGGLGWPVLVNLTQAARRRAALNAHSKLALGTTACAYLVGVVLIAAAQLAPRTYDFFKLGNEPNKTIYASTTAATLGGALADASFMTITVRTGGFNTVPMNDLTPAADITLIALMFIGGSPGGAAGGVKTIVVALLALNLYAAVRRQKEVIVFGVTVPDALLRRAAAAAAAMFVLVAGATLLLSISEASPLLKTTFEVVSASCNAGLSLGITDSLTGFGKSILIACMFIGRLGPVALAGAFLADDDEEPDDGETVLPLSDPLSP